MNSPFRVCRLEHFDAGNVQQRTDGNPIRIRVNDDEPRPRKVGKFGVPNRMNFAVGKVNGERLEWLSVQ
jgi:hypothetical protein